MIIGTYPGMLPSTPFINRQIEAIAMSGYKVYVFGSANGKIKYDHPEIHVFAKPLKRLQYIGRALGQCLLLLILHPNRFITYFKWAYKVKRNRQQMIRELPVVLYLPDVFHVQWAKAAADWFFLKELFSVKLAMSLRGAQINYSPVLDPRLANIYREYFPRYDKFHAVSNAIAKEASLYGADEDKIKVIYSGIDIPSTQKKQYEKSTVLKILSVGRMHWIKGYDYALEAMKIVADKAVDFKYTIVAGGNPEEYVFLKHDMKLDDKVEILSSKPFEEVLRVMTEYDVLLLPSVVEGIANVAIEAMAVGLPVISSDASGMKELVTDGETGFVFPARNAESLAASIIQFNDTTALQREAIARRAKQSLKGKFDFETFSKGFDSFYKEIAG